MGMRKKRKNAGEGLVFLFFRGSRRMMMLFLVVMTLLWMVPVYSLVKDSLKVNGLLNYWYVLTNRVNGVPFYKYFVNSAVNAAGAALLLVVICSFFGFCVFKN